MPDIIREPGLVEQVTNGFVPFRTVFELLPEEFRTVIVAAVALGVLIGIFHLLSR